MVAVPGIVVRDCITCANLLFLHFDIWPVFLLVIFVTQGTIFDLYFISTLVESRSQQTTWSVMVGGADCTTSGSGAIWWKSSYKHVGDFCVRMQSVSLAEN